MGVSLGASVLSGGLGRVVVALKLAVPMMAPRRCRSATDRGEVDPLVVRGDHDLEVVEEAGKPKQAEGGSPRVTKPDRCAPFVRLIRVRQEEADLCHASRHDCTANSELLRRRRVQVYPAEFGEVRAKPNCCRTAVQQASLRGDVQALDDDVEDGPRTDAFTPGLGNLSKAKPH